MITFTAVETLLVVAAFGGMIFIGRACKSVACMFLPMDPFTLSIIGAAAGVYILSDLFEVVIPTFTGVMIMAAIAGYLLGYLLGDFSHRGVIELKMNKLVSLDAKNIAYYRNSELDSYCIQEQTPWACFMRLFFGRHNTLEFPFDEISSRTEVSVDNNYIRLRVTGAMTYVVHTETRTRMKGKKTITYTHYKYVLADITQQGPYDFFFRTMLYLDAISIADAAKAKQLAADIKCRAAATEGGATILESISKMEPEDAAASLKQLKDFIDTESKTVAEASADAPDAAPATEAASVRRWPWSKWRKTQ